MMKSEVFYMTPDAAADYAELMERDITGATFTEPTLKASSVLGEEMSTSTAEEPRLSADGRTLTLPIKGMITDKADALMAMFGQAQTVAGQVEDAARKVARLDTVENVVLDIDSPGGTMGGLEGARQAIKALRETKNVIALGDHTMASAAYYLGSAADVVLATPNSTIGSIGTATVLTDKSEAYEKAGIKHHIIRTGEHKLKGSGLEQITDSDVELFQERAERAHNIFVGAVADNRNLTIETVNQMADGNVHMGDDAVQKGFADGTVLSRAQLMDMLAKDVSEDNEEARQVASNAAEVVTTLMSTVDQKFSEIQEQTKRERATAIVNQAIATDRIPAGMKEQHVSAAMRVGVDEYKEILGALPSRQTAISTNSDDSVSTPASKTQSEAGVVTLHYGEGEVKDFDLGDPVVVGNLQRMPTLRKKVLTAATEQQVRVPKELKN